MAADPGDNLADLPVGSALAQLRRRARLTGAELGRRVGMSQAKISRLENGVGSPGPADIAAIARVLGATDEEVRRLAERAEELARDRITDWRLRTPGPSTAQETRATTFRLFQPTVVLGLLQTSEYARAVLAASRRPRPGTCPDASGPGLAEAVSRRMMRQVVLADRARRFHLVMAETALLNRICPPEVMPAQLRRLREVARQDNVSLGIVPVDLRWGIIPVHGFDVLDDRTVEVDLITAGLVTRSRSDVRLYRQVFDAIEDQATTEIDPILDRYMELYLELARPSGDPLSGA